MQVFLLLKVLETFEFMLRKSHNEATGDFDTKIWNGFDPKVFEQARQLNDKVMKKESCNGKYSMW